MADLSYLLLIFIGISGSSAFGKNFCGIIDSFMHLNALLCYML